MKEKITPNWILIIVAILFTVSGIALVVSDIKIKSNSDEITAVVSEVKKYSSRGNYYTYVTYSYEGKVYENISYSTTGHPNNNEGDVVKIYVNKNKPTKINRVGTSVVSMGILGLGLLLILGVVVDYRNRKYND